MNLINNNNIVCVYLYTSTDHLNFTEDHRLYLFDSATIIYDAQKNNHNKQCIIKSKNNLIDSVMLYMKYDMAQQFLKRLNFNYDATNTYDNYVAVYEYWSSSIISDKVCFTLDELNYQEENGLPF